MSGEEKRFTVARAFGNGFDVCDGDDGDKAVVLNLVNLSEAHAVAGALNSLAARSGSPEGWPEGADAEGAELVALASLDGPLSDWEVWSEFGTEYGGNQWVDKAGDYVDMLPTNLLVVARRKPKPVTRGAVITAGRGDS